LNKKRVLYVDDDPCMREAGATYLEALDYVVVQEEQGNKALHTYRHAEEPWDFVLSDFQFLPGLTIKNGAMLIAAILRENPAQRVAIHSAEPDLVRRALRYLQDIKQLGSNVEVQVLAKPYRMKELLELMGEEVPAAQNS
jgi:CheY-like chemotaxis protein